MKDIDENVCSDATICFVDVNKYLEGVRCEYMCLGVVIKDGKEEVEEAPIKVKNLLEEFPNIVLDNVPDGLPPVWKISH